MEDTDIIELFLNRSEEAIRQTDIKYSKLCFGIAWNILLNKEDSEECVNDTWLITWNEIPPKIPKILSAFLGKITRNQAIDSHMADINGELERLEETVQYSLEHNIKRQEILDVLDEFLKGLKEEDRDIFVRRYWYMDDIKEISKRHSVSESKVKSSLFRSRKKLWKKAGDLL